MPTYEYECSNNNPHNGCGHVWEEILSIEDRMKPMNAPCPKCKKKDQIIRHFNAHLFHGVVNPLKKMPEDFKEQMARIKRENPAMKTSYF